MINRTYGPPTVPADAGASASVDYPDPGGKTEIILHCPQIRGTYADPLLRAKRLGVICEKGGRGGGSATNILFVCLSARKSSSDIYTSFAKMSKAK